MSKYEITVIIPTYNNANFIAAAIDSVLEQTFQNFELIIVDDGSTDSTQQIVEKYVKCESRITYIYQDNSGGAARPKNIGIKHAKGIYIAILDADDIWLPSKLEKQMRLIKKSPAKVGIIGCSYFLKQDEVVNGKVYVNMYSDQLRNILLRDYLGPGSSMIYKKSVFDAVGLFDENLRTSQDWEMRIRILQSYHVAIVNEPLVTYRLHENNISKVSVAVRDNDYKYIFNKYKSLYEKDDNVLSLYYYYNATRFLSAGDAIKARVNIVRSIKIKVNSFKQIALLFFSIINPYFYRSAVANVNKFRNFSNKFLRVLGNSFKNPFFYLVYIFAYFQSDYKCTVNFYENEEVMQTLQKHASLVRFGDGEVNVLLGMEMPYHEINAKLTAEFKKLVKSMFEEKNMLLAVPSYITKSNIDLKKENKLRTWLPFKVIYKMLFRNDIKYVDAHSFYCEQVISNVLEGVLKEKKVMIVTKKESLDRIDQNIGVSQILVPMTDHNAFSDINLIKSKINIEIEKNSTSKLIIIFAAGPVGKLLAIHYHKKNIQCIDIGKGIEKFLIKKYK